MTQKPNWQPAFERANTTCLPSGETSGMFAFGICGFIPITMPVAASRTVSPAASVVITLEPSGVSAS